MLTKRRAVNLSYGPVVLGTLRGYGESVPRESWTTFVRQDVVALDQLDPVTELPPDATVLVHCNVLKASS